MTNPDDPDKAISVKHNNGNNYLEKIESKLVHFNVNIVTHHIHSSG